MKKNAYFEIKKTRDKNPRCVAYRQVLLFIEQVLEVMEREGIKKIDLAEKMNTSRAYITRLLDGSINITLETIAKVCIALEMEINLKIVKPNRSENESPCKKDDFSDFDRSEELIKRKQYLSISDTPIRKYNKKVKNIINRDFNELNFKCEAESYSYAECIGA